MQAKRENIIRKIDFISICTESSIKFPAGYATWRSATERTPSVEKPIDFWLRNNRAPAAKKREGGRGEQADRDKEKSPHFEESAQA